MAEQPLIDSLDGIVYLVDAMGRITSYGRPHWNDFALNNGAPELCDPGNVIGVDLLGAVQGDDVRETYRHLVGDLLEGQRKSLSFRFRCDAPDTKRHMRMALSPVLEGGEVAGVLFQSVMLESEMRPSQGIFRFSEYALAAGPVSEQPIVTVCSYCQNVKPPEDDGLDIEWVSGDEYYRRGGRSDVQISHGICGGCIDRILVGK